MKKIQVSAPAKIHLIGEHAVVYGYPALLAAIDRKTTVGFASGQKVSDPYVQKCLEEGFGYFGQEVPNDVDVTVLSDIPQGAGMGSSAALAVAIAGLIVQRIRGKLDKETINEIALKCEVFMHGTPSGADNTTSCFGGMVWFEKGKRKHVDVNIQDFASDFFLLNTGKPDETTKEMVNLVRERYKRDRSEVEKIFESQAGLVLKLVKSLEKNASENIALCIQKAEENLEKLGVVSRSTQKIIRSLEQQGCAAKICGAGGRANASGIVLMYNPQKKRIIVPGLKLELMRFDQEGVRVEK